mgnify:CR=1 FL=1
MRAHPQNASSTNADQRLSQLIKLKRMEKPDAAYWQRFDQEFRSRQLTTFVHIQPVHTRLRRACMLLARKAAPPVAAAGAVALTFFAATNTSYLADHDEIESPTAAPPRGLAGEPQEAYFLVSDGDASAPQEDATPSGTVYQIHALSNSGATADGYTLNTTPVTYSQRGTEQGAAAPVLSTRRND